MYKWFIAVLAAIAISVFLSSCADEIPEEIIRSSVSSAAKEEFATILQLPETMEELKSRSMACKRYEKSYLPGRTAEEAGSYIGKDAAIYLRKVAFGSGNDTVTAVVADVFVKDIRALSACVLTDESGNVIKGTPEDVLAQRDAILLMNSDFIKGRSWGLYIREGVLFKQKTTSGIDLCAIGKDGKMEILDGDDIDVRAIQNDTNTWHIFSFGPALLSYGGKPMDSNADFRIGENYSQYNVETGTGFLANNPRSAIGQASDGHFILVAVDGRRKGYSRGMNMPELSHLLYEEGAEVAYNLDGGGSVFFYFDGEPINKNTGGRDPSDYLCILREQEQQ